MNKVKAGVPAQKKYHKPIRIQDIVPPVTFVLMFAVSAVLSGILNLNFLTAENLLNILRQQSSLLIVSMGMLLVILTGGIDLSVGSMWGLGAVVVALLSRAFGSTVAVLITIVILTLVGAVSGALVSYRRLAPFVVTLAMLTMARGVAYIVTNSGKQIFLPDNSWLRIFDSSTIAGFPVSVIFALVIFALAMLLLRYTGFGRLTKAIGSNESAVRLSGIRVNVLKMSVYAISGGLCAIAGIVAAARNSGAKFDFGSGMELQAIAAVVIGGASLSGGKGTALNTLMGVLILGLLRNMMNMLHVSTAYQDVFTGVIIIFAVLLQSFQSKKNV